MKKINQNEYIGNKEIFDNTIFSITTKKQANLGKKALKKSKNKK